ncbi:hypothetical protein INR49_003673 [Caranx melampygus]|nr:hypothetical protein INR49_003673 [Caranx melampygus]
MDISPADCCCNLDQSIGYRSVVPDLQLLSVEIEPWPPAGVGRGGWDKDFGKQTLHKGHANPLAEVTTSLKTYQHFTLEKAYLGEDFFWAFTPVAGDFIRIRFFTPVRIERYFFRSGNIEHPGDKLFNTSVEVLPFDNIQAEKEALTEGREKTPKYHRTEDGFIRIGTFQNGIAEGEVDPTFGPLEAMRLSVITDSPVWVILSETSTEALGCCIRVHGQILVFTLSRFYQESIESSLRRQSEAPPPFSDTSAPLSGQPSRHEARQLPSCSPDPTTVPQCRHVAGTHHCRMNRPETGNTETHSQAGR